MGVRERFVSVSPSFLSSFCCLLVSDRVINFIVDDGFFSKPNGLNGLNGEWVSVLAFFGGGRLSTTTFEV